MITFTDKQHADFAIECFNGKCTLSLMPLFLSSARTRSVWEDDQC